MKLRTSITLFCVLLIHFTSNAQTYHLGLRTGYSQSSLSADAESAVSLKDRKSFSIGLVHSIRPYQSKFGFSIETVNCLVAGFGKILTKFSFTNCLFVPVCAYIHDCVWKNNLLAATFGRTLIISLGFLADVNNSKFFLIKKMV